METFLYEEFPEPHLIGGIENPTVIEVESQESELIHGVRHFNCVEVTKALLGIRRFWVFTPYQLYRYLHVTG